MFCAVAMCKKSFESVDCMLYHLNYEEHEYDDTKTATQLSKVADKWVQRFSVEESNDVASSSGSHTIDIDAKNESELMMGWAVPKRSNRRLTAAQKKFLDFLFDEGVRTHMKISPEQALEKMKVAFDDPKDFLPLGSIKSYFSRRAKSISEGKIKIGEVIPEEKEVETLTDEEMHLEQNSNSEECDEDEGTSYEEGQKKITERILSVIENTPDLQTDDWIAVDMGSSWLPGQFIKFDMEQEELHVNFLHRSTSNKKWFVWPQLQLNGSEDKSWVTELSVFYRLDAPKEGRRDTLIFDQHDEVDKVFSNIEK